MLGCSLREFSMAEIRTLLLLQPTNADALAEALGVEPARRLLEEHARRVVALLASHGGAEIDRADGWRGAPHPALKRAPSPRSVTILLGPRALPAR